MKAKTESSPSPSSNSGDEIVVPRVLGVCGGIGCGKSSACRTLVEELGCMGHIDSDRLAHTVYDTHGPYSALSDIVAAFGSSIVVDGDGIDRKKLGSIVFADPLAMGKLERIVWPYVRRKVGEEIAKLQEEWMANTTGSTANDKKGKKIPVIVLEAAVLLDAGWQDDVDGVWVVTASAETALQRLQDTRDLSEKEALKRMEAQTSRRGIGNIGEEVSNGVVTAIIQNDGTKEDLLAVLETKLRDPTAWYTRVKGSIVPKSTTSSTK